MRGSFPGYSPGDHGRRADRPLRRAPDPPGRPEAARRAGGGRARRRGRRARRAHRHRHAQRARLRDPQRRRRAARGRPGPGQLALARRRAAPRGQPQRLARRVRPQRPRRRGRDGAARRCAAGRGAGAGRDRRGLRRRAGDRAPPAARRLARRSRAAGRHERGRAAEPDLHVGHDRSGQGRAPRPRDARALVHPGGRDAGRDGPAAGDEHARDRADLPRGAERPGPVRGRARDRPDDHAAVRRRGHAAPGRASPHRPRAGGPDDVRAPARAARGGARALRPRLAAGGRPRRRAVPGARQADG